MGPHNMWVESIQDFVFAALFVVTAPSLAKFLYRKTRCYPAAMLVGIGMIAAAAGLVLLGMAAYQYFLWNPDGSEPYANGALVFQLGGAGVMSGGLIFTNIYGKKLRDAGCVDDTLRANAIGIRVRHFAEADRNR